MIKNKNLKIAIIIPYLYDGGAERIASLWVNYLSSIYTNITLITFYRLEKEYYVLPNIRWISLYKDKNEYINISKNKFLKFFKVLFKLRSIIKNGKFDILIPFMMFIYNFVCLASLFLKQKIVLNIRAYPGSSPLLHRILNKIFLFHYKYIFVQNEEQKEYYGRINQKNIFVIPNILNNDCLEISKSNIMSIKNIVSVGRLWKQKNYKMVIDTATYLKQRGYNFTFSIYGSGPDLNKLEKYSCKKGVNDIILFKGNSTKIFLEIIKYDLFLMTSLFEGFPNSLLEAMAIGMPVISTECKTGPKTLISNKKDGYLVKINDVKTLANLIIYLSNNIDEVNHIRLIGQNKVRLKYNKNNVLNILIDSIEKLY